MPRMSPYLVQLTQAEREELEARARRYTSPYRDVIRAKIVLLAAQGLANDVIAARLDTPRQIVSKWRKRFCRRAPPGPRRAAPRRAASPLFPPASSSTSRRWPVSCRTRRAAAGALVAWPTLRREVIAQGHRRADQRHDALALAQPGCIPPLAPSQLDLPARPALRRQGRPHPGPVCTAAGRAAPRARGTTSSPPTRRPASRRGGARTPRCRRAPGRPMRVEHEYDAGRRLGLPRGLGCPSGQGLRPLRAQDRHRPVRPPGRPGHARRSPTARPAASSGSSTTAPRIAGQRADARLQAALAAARPRPYPGPRQLAQPDRDLLLDRPAQGPHAQRLRLARPHVEDRLLHFQAHYEHSATPVPVDLHPRATCIASWPSSPTRPAASPREPAMKYVTVIANRST